jgi:exoribonuclease R
MIPRNEQLIAYVEARKEPVRFDDLMRGLQLPKKDEQALRPALASLVRKGFLTFFPGGSYGTKKHTLTRPASHPTSPTHSHSPAVARRKNLFSSAREMDFPNLQVRPLPSLDETRIDLRQVPFVTIDDAGAHDLDDAIFAEETTDGFRLLVSIADVAHYVRPGDELDREVYAPQNRLPTKIADMCSLKPGVDRVCLTFDILIDKQGTVKTHQFYRGLMRSVARLTPNQVKAAHNGHADRATAPLMKKVINPLYEAHAALMKSHGVKNRLVEEFMVCANIAATKALESKQFPCLYPKKGHRRYGHFTSPIRSDSDLLLQRLLITAFGKGAGALNPEQLENFRPIPGTEMGPARADWKARHNGPAPV